MRYVPASITMPEERLFWISAPLSTLGLTVNPKKFWSYVKHSKSENLGIPPLKTVDGLSITDKDKAETLNSYFFSVFTREQMPLPEIGPSPFHSIGDLQFSPNGVAKQLAQLNPQKACGPDELPSRVRKQLLSGSPSYSHSHFISCTIRLVQISRYCSL